MKPLTLAERLKDARRRTHKTQVQVASEAGMEQASYSDLERGVSTSSRRLTQLARALGVRPLWLATGELPRYEDGTSEPADGAPPGRLRSSEMTKKQILTYARSLSREEQLALMAELAIALRDSAD